MKVVLIGAALLCAIAALPARAGQVSSKDLGALKWREVGPAVMGGRLDVAVGVPGDPRTIYLGHSSGGLYKSTDGGLTFAAIFHSGGSSSIGALAVAQSDPKIVFVGTGEGFPRNTAAPGDGVFKSIDAGKTWHYVGLRDTKQIAKIAIDPHDPRVILVAALGPEWLPGGERGVYRSQDGGKTWTRVVFVNSTTGGSDVAFDPQNPSIVYAGTFDFIRRPWTFRGGGPGSGLYRSADNGRTWEKLTAPALHDGLPGGTINRVGVSVCYEHPNVVYAFVPNKRGVLYRSDDAGSHWKLVNASGDIDFRPFYFSQLRADPHDPNRVYLPSEGNQVSTDGGKTFKHLGGGGDNHDIWIDPQNPDRLLNASDFGLDMSADRGKTWDHLNTVPFAQVYRVGYDDALPYHIMGGMQDHEVWWGPNSLWNDDGVPSGAWRNISQWGDGQYALPDPRDSNVIYEDTHFGDLVRRDLRTGEARYISPQPAITFGTGAGAYRYRFSWSAPLYISPHDPSVVYFGGNVLFKSTDEGTSWQTISPDLSQPCNRAYLGPSGGPLGHDDTNAEAYCTIYAISEDAGDPNTLWVGTDDGNLEITRDGGKRWTNVVANVRGLPAHSWVSSIHASHVTPGTAYVCFDRHRFGDERPYAYVTTDYGKHWSNISRGLPSYAYVVLEDPRQPLLLFAGTQQGVSASFDRGAHWTSLQLGQPPVPVYDLKIQPQANDLIAGTHGRGFWILDDITPLERLAEAVGKKATLFAPMPAWRYVSRPTYEQGRGGFVSQNKPYGVAFSYYLAPLKGRKKYDRVTIRITDAAGKLVRSLHGPAKRGVNRTVWDLHADPPRGKDVVQDTREYYVFYSPAIDGPEVAPGTYTATLIADGRTYSRSTPVQVNLDPAVGATAAALKAQYDALWQLVVIQEQGEVTLNELHGLDAQIAKLLAHKPPAAIRKELLSYRAAVDALSGRLVNGNGGENAAYQHPAQLIDQIAYLRHIEATYTGALTDAQQALADRYAAQMSRLNAEATALFSSKLKRVNARLATRKLPPLRVRITHTKGARDR